MLATATATGGLAFEMDRKSINSDLAEQVGRISSHLTLDNLTENENKSRYFE